MATYTDAEMLESIRAAIKSLVDGGAQARTVDGRSWTGLRLPDLREQERFYQSRVNLGTTTRNRASFRRPS